MTKINYNIHLILTSKYRPLYHFTIILLIYITMYGNKVIFCMNDNPDIVDVSYVAEAKEPHRPSHQILAIRKQIESYIGTDLAEKIENDISKLEFKKKRGFDPIIEKNRVLQEEHKLLYSEYIVHDVLEKFKPFKIDKIRCSLNEIKENLVINEINPSLPTRRVIIDLQDEVTNYAKTQITLLDQINEIEKARIELKEVSKEIMLINKNLTKLNLVSSYYHKTS